MISVDLSNVESIESRNHLYQWDKGQQLEIKGLGVSKAPEIHFGVNGSMLAIVVNSTLSGGIVYADIPNEILMSGKDLRVYVHIDGTTIKNILIPVFKRNMPENYVVDSSNVTWIEEFETEVNEITTAKLTEIDRKGTQTLDSIPNDYTALQNDVTELKDEVTKARLNTSGITYSTLKVRLDAMDAETAAKINTSAVESTLADSTNPVQSKVVKEAVTDLKSDLIKVTENGTFQRKIEWLQGNINSSDDADDASITTRIRSAEGVYYPVKDIYIEIGSGQAIIFFLYDENKLFIENGEWQTQSGLFSDFGSSSYVRFMIKNTNDANIVPSDVNVFVYDTTPLSEVYNNVNELVGADLESRIENIASYVNLFDVSTLKEGSISVNGADTPDTGVFRSEFIEVKPNTQYTLTAFAGKDSYRTDLVYEYNSNKTLLAFHLQDEDVAPYSYSFVTTSTTKYIKFRSGYGSSEQGFINALYQLEKGTKTSYCAFGVCRLNPDILPDILVESAKFNLDYYAVENVNAIDGSINEYFDAENMTEVDVFSKYDALLNTHPDYVTRKTLGFDASNNYPIRAYYFTPPYVSILHGDTAQVLDDKPHYKKIILTSGTHGNGTGGDNCESIVALYEFANALCENSGNNKYLYDIRNNYQVIIVPLVNPWGVVNKSRYNSRGVDINRNFTNGWKTSEHSGNNSLSEPESIAIDALLSDNNDTLFCFDVHTRGGDTFQQTYPQILGICTDGDDIEHSFQASIGKVKSKFDGFSADLYRHGVFGCIRSQCRYYNIHSATIECTFMAENNGQKHTALSNKVNIEMLINSIIECIKKYS